MPDLIHQLITAQAARQPDATALRYRDEVVSYADFAATLERVSASLAALGVGRDDRVGVYLPKLPQTVYSLLGAAMAGGVFVPINPILKPAQVAYILRDCNIKVLVTAKQRFEQLAEELPGCPDLQTVVVCEDEGPADTLPWPEFLAMGADRSGMARRIDTDMAAILYTSGSTGNPKGVVLSHRNLVAGARSVASYLENRPEDRILSVLPLSFDAGLSQLTTGFSAGASVTLMDYLLPRDVIRAVAKYRITGLTGVPPLWNQLPATTAKLRAALPATDVYLMYGLTEAFRSTYLPPDQVGTRPDSIGKAIPNAEILVVRPDGSECDPDEPGELVHRGPLVAMGYWNEPAKTAERFKPCPGQLDELPLTEIAVWSGDQVRRDAEGYLYFISRMDEMIKTSGYRVSPTEVEDCVHASGLVSEVAAIGLPHPVIGQAILLLACPRDGAGETDIVGHCQRELPNYMVPQAVELVEALPRNQNGKIDRKRLSLAHADRFTGVET
jgi:acyl-CoA synthetase (AMP-forming)/AMP-acid ligase II